MQIFEGFLIHKVVIWYQANNSPAQKSIAT